LAEMCESVSVGDNYMVLLERGVCLVHRKPVFILVDVDGQRHAFDVFPWVSKSRIVWHHQLAESVKCSKPGKQGRQEEIVSRRQTLQTIFSSYFACL
jgi:hypothetical protein